jgi:hypothetical protein
MNKRLFLGTILTLFLAVIVSTANVFPVLASVTYYDHANGGGRTIIDIADHQPRFQIYVAHYDGGDNGVGDYLEVDLWQYVPQLGKFVWKVVAIVTDSPSIAAFNKDFVYAGLPGVPVTVLLVKHCQLQVYRIGRFVFAYWTEPIATPGITLPPGCLLLRGYGDAQTVHQVFSLPNGVTITVDAETLKAHATLVCPEWKHCGPVGDEGTTMNIGFDQWTTHV